MDMDKLFNNSKWFAVGLLVLVLIVFIVSFSGNKYTTITIVVHIGMIVALIGTIIGCNNQTMLGPICGIMVCVLMVIFGGLIEKVFGILYLIDCIKLIKGLNS